MEENRCVPGEYHRVGIAGHVSEKANPAKSCEWWGQSIVRMAM